MPSIFHLLQQQEKIVLGLKRYRQRSTMIVYLEKIGISLEDLRKGELVIIGQDSDIIEPYRWTSEIRESAVVR
jgi:hypothetical protein